MFLTATQILTFLPAAALITLSPGPDNLMVLSLGTSHGRRQGMWFGLGCALGCLNHTILAAIGVSALIVTSELAFSALKIAGGLYLIYLGGLAVGRKRDSNLRSYGVCQKSLQGLFIKGLFVNSVNPKVILFFLAFLPQFVNATQSNTNWQIIQLGILFTLQASIIFCALGYFSGCVGQWIVRNPKCGIWLDRIAGGIFICLGLRIMWVT